MSDMMPTIYTYESPEKGPHLLVFGRVHGNEPCGTEGIMRHVTNFEEGFLSLQKGKVTFVPICNPRAAALNVRFTQDNLNRVFRMHDEPQTYEQELANILCPLIDEADYLLDLHSTSAPSAPFVFVDTDNDESGEWAAHMDFAYLNFPTVNIVTGWSALYPPEHGEWSSTDYARFKGKMALTVECGQHEYEHAGEIAKQAVINSLCYFGMVKGGEDYIVKSPVKKSHLTYMYRKRMAGCFLSPFENFSPVVQGQPLIEYEDGEIITSPVTGLVFLPKANANIGIDWLYLAVSVD